MQLTYLLKFRLQYLTPALWTLIGILTIFKAIVNLNHAGQNIYLGHISSYTFTSIIFWIIFTRIIQWQLSWMKFKGLNALHSVAIHLTSAILISAAQRLLSLSLDHFIQSNYIVSSFPPLSEYLNQFYLKRFMDGVWVYLAIVLFFKLIDYYLRIYDKEINTESLLIKRKGAIQKIPFDEISLIRSDRNYVEIIGKHRYKHRTTLKQLEVELMDSPFIRIHHSYLINKEKLIAKSHISNGDYKIKLDGYEGYLSSSKTYRENIKSLDSQFMK